MRETLKESLTLVLATIAIFYQMLTLLDKLFDQFGDYFGKGSP